MKRTKKAGTLKIQRESVRILTDAEAEAANGGYSPWTQVQSVCACNTLYSCPDYNAGSWGGYSGGYSGGYGGWW